MAWLVLAALLTSPVPGRAQPTDVPSLRLLVTQLDGVVGAGSLGGTDDARLRVAIDNAGDSAVSDVRVVVEVHRQARSRGLLRAALDRDVHSTGAGFVTDHLVRDGALLAPGDIAGVSLTLDGGSAGWTGTSGVHPVAISVVRGTQVLDRVVTAVIHLGQAPSTTLDTLVAWPLDDEPWRLGIGEFAPGADADIEPGGRLDRLVRGLEAAPDAPVALAPSAHLLEDLLDRADGFIRVDGSDNPRLAPDSAEAVRANSMLQRIRAAAAGRAVAPIATPYGGVDLALLARAPGPASDIASDAVASVHDRVEDLLGREPSAGVDLVTDEIGDQGLSLLSSRTVVVSWDAVAGPDLALDATLDSPVRQITTQGGRRVTLLVADPYIERMLEGPDPDAGPVVAAQRVLAESAMVHFQAPGRADRPLVVLLPRNADLPGDTAARILRGLANAPWLALADAETVRDGADIDPASLLEVAGLPGLPDDLLESLEATSELVDGLDRTLVRQGTETIDPARLRDDLARSSSVWFRSDLAARRRGVARVHTAARAALGTIDVASTTGITLTAEQGTIPITLRRPDGAPLDVRVAVDARGRLGWPEGSQSETIRLAPGIPQTVSFATIARTRGTFPLLVRVTDPSGTRILHEATISVRSTAISRPAVIVLGAVVLLLVGVGLVRRRPRRTRLRAVQDLPQPPASDEH